jgi:CRP/FNR family transcriptional regulator
VQTQTYGRLANKLLYLANEIYNCDEFDLPLNRNELADLICTSRETVSRMLSDLANENIIDINGKHLKIIDKQRLENISLRG